MKRSTRLIGGSAKFWVGVLAVIAALLAVARDGTPVQAATGEVLPSVSSTSPSYSSSVLLVKGGRASTTRYLPCDPGDTDPSTVCLRIWAKNVPVPPGSNGASAFSVHYTYPTSVMTVSAFAASTTWLGSTGRSVSCPEPSFTPGEGTITCTTLLAPPPFGPTGNGILANIALVSNDTPGSGVFTLEADTQLVDTTVSWPSLDLIPITIRSITVVVAPCADFNADGHITAADILYVVRAFGSNDPDADLDGSGTVTAADILISVKEFAYSCTR